MSACAYTAVNHHSIDLYTVYNGSPEPLTLCGYHSQQGVIGRVFAWLKEATS